MAPTTKVKRHKPTFLARIRRGRRAGLSLAVVVLGVISGVASIAGFASLILFAVAGGVTVLVGLVAAFVRGRLTYIPPTIIAEARDSDGRYEGRYSTSQELEEACEMSRPVYRHEYVDSTVAEQWRTKNSHAFVSIVNNANELCACFGVLGLVESCFDEFVRGRIRDTEFRGEDVLSYQDARAARRLYISGVVVREHESQLGHRRAWVMIWCILEYLRQVVGVNVDRHLYALAVSRDGEQLLRNLGFTISTRKESRKDGCNLYSLRFSEDTWQRLARRFGDPSSICYLHF